MTGYILAGILCGPYVLGLLQADECAHLSKLVTNDAMGFIGFSAGAKFLLSELSGSLKTILLVILGQTVAIYALVFSTIFFLAPMLELTAGRSPHAVFATALIVSCLAVARSPTSAIALVSELGAHGPFTTAILSVIILIDVLVVLLFALTLLVVEATSPAVAGVEPPSAWGILGLFAMQMLVSAVVGVLLGYLLHGFIHLTTSATATAGERAEALPQPPHKADKPTGKAAAGGPAPDVGGSSETMSGAEQVIAAEQMAAAAAATSATLTSRPNQAAAAKAGGTAGGSAGATAAAKGGAKPRPLRRFNSVIGAADHVSGASAAASAALSKSADEASGALFAAPEAAYRRRAALMAALWLGAKVALLIAESLIMQAAGFEVFETEELEERAFGVAFHQPLVISMVAGFVVVNFTSSRRAFLRILHDSSEPVYIAFFTLTGMTLQLGTLLPNLPTALLIFSLRLAGIYAGALWGGRLGGAPPSHVERYWMTFVTQAGVTLGLAQRVSVQFADSFGPGLALTITAEVVLNQLVGPLLFKAAIIGVGEAHSQYSPGNGPGQLGVSQPVRPQPRSGVLVAAKDDPEAAALCARLTARQWDLLRCEAGPDDHDEEAGGGAGGAAGATDPTDPMYYRARGNGGLAALLKRPVLSEAASARRASRLHQLLSEATDPALSGRLRMLVAAAERATSQAKAGAGAAAPKDVTAESSASTAVGVATGMAALAEPLLAAAGTAGAVASVSAAGQLEMRLLWAIASLEALDTLIVLLPSDMEAIEMIKLLQSSAALLPLIHQRQTSTPQLLVKLVSPEYERLVSSLCPPGFEATAVVTRAAVPNLLAEVLHPDCHWSKALDNSLPSGGQA